MKDRLKTILWFGLSAGWDYFATTVIASYK